MIDKDYKERMAKCCSDLEEQYELLDLILSERTHLLPYLDNANNLYAYSSRVLLLNGINMVIKGNSGYSEMDLVNRIIHYIALQYDLFFNIDDNKGFGVIAYSDNNVVEIINRIKIILVHTAQTVATTIPNESLPIYIASWLSKYAVLRISEEELKRSKTIIETLEVVV